MTLKLLKRGKLAPGELDVLQADEEDLEWFEARVKELQRKYRGKYLAIVNKELFVGESFAAARDAAKAKYPDREPLVEFIPIKKRVMVL